MYKLLEMAGYPMTFSQEELTLFAKCIGGAMITCSGCIVLGILRSFAALMLAFIIGVFTVCQHVDLADPRKTDPVEQVTAVKNLAFIGAFIIIAGLGKRRKCETATSPLSQAKKRQ